MLEQQSKCQTNQELNIENASFWEYKSTYISNVIDVIYPCAYKTIYQVTKSKITYLSTHLWTWFLTVVGCPDQYRFLKFHLMKGIIHIPVPAHNLQSLFYIKLLVQKIRSTFLSMTSIWYNLWTYFIICPLLLSCSDPLKANKFRKQEIYSDYSTSGCIEEGLQILHQWTSNRHATSVLQKQGDLPVAVIRCCLV